MPDYVVRPSPASGQTPGIKVDISGWPQIGQPGAPSLPYTSTLIVLPPEGGIDFSFEILGETVIPLSAPVAPAPEPVRQNGADGILAADTVLSQDRQIYEGEALYPTSPVTVTEIGVVRGLRLGRLTAYPIRYDPVAQRLIVLDALRVDLRFDQGAKAPGREAVAVDALQRAIQSLVLNPEAVYDNRLSATRTEAHEASVPEASLQFTLREPGRYTLAWQRLVALGLVPADGDPDYVHIRRPATGAEIALSWNPEQQQYRFYAEPVPSRWADYEVYRVTYEETPGLRMVARPCDVLPPHRLFIPLLIAGDGLDDVTPSSGISVASVAEENRRYDSLYVSERDGQSWYWACLQQPASAQCPTALSAQVHVASPSAAGEAEIEVWFQGYTRTEHRIEILVNGEAVGDAHWFGKLPFSTRLRFPAAYLTDGDNTVRLIRSGGDSGDGLGGAWVDAFVLRYDVARVDELPLRFSNRSERRGFHLQGVPASFALYDVTDPDRPEELLGCVWRDEVLYVTDWQGEAKRYLLVDAVTETEIEALHPPADLPEPMGADYLAIVPQDWLDELRLLLDHREAEGLVTFAAPLESIYDHYGDGRQDPEAIRAFVSHAYASWTPKPTYLLLVGDGTWDPLNYLGTDARTWLPPYLVDVDPWMGEVPADNRYAAVDGDDLLPDLVVGRLPVNSAEELEATIDKVLTYEQDTSVALWKVRHLFAVDNDDGVNTFSASAGIVTPLAPPTHTVALMQMPGLGTDDITTEHERLLSQLERGALVVNWIGHSSWQQWEHRRLFHTDDLAGLPKSERLPVVFEMTCFTSNFAHPEAKHTGLDEALVRLPEAGALATWGSSGGGLDAAHQLLHAGVYRALFGAEQPPVGEATLVAKLATPADALHLLDTFHYFGDPALHLQRSRPLHTIYLPTTYRSGSGRLYLPVVTQ